MYYFLGYRLWADECGILRKQTRADNTFLMALDGDVDFEPKAMQLLVDLMKKDAKVGAACGRIHPTGSGMLSLFCLKLLKHCFTISCDLFVYSGPISF